MSFAETSNILVGKLRRITSSSLFIPEIDGLRFLAIFLVVVYHVSGEVVLRGKFIVASAPFFHQIVYRFLNNGYKGVLLFFTISGFILALPFAKHVIKKEKAVRKIITKSRLVFIVLVFYFDLFFQLHPFSL